MKLKEDWVFLESLHLPVRRAPELGLDGGRDPFVVMSFERRENHEKAVFSRRKYVGVRIRHHTFLMLQSCLQARTVAVGQDPRKDVKGRRVVVQERADRVGKGKVTLCDLFFDDRHGVFIATAAVACLRRLICFGCSTATSGAGRAGPARALRRNPLPP